jgi:hypothetical protein
VSFVSLLCRTEVADPTDACFPLAHGSGTEQHMKAIDPQRDWKTLLGYLPREYAQLAQEHGVLHTQWPNAKVKDADTLLRFILLHVAADLPLRQTVATIARSGGPKISQVWLHQRMRRAQPYLAALVQRTATDANREAIPERWAGYEMVCLDGSTVTSPGAEGVDARLHVVLRLHDLQVCDVRVTTELEGETLRRFIWQPEQLVIVDRGYSNAPGIAWVLAHKADVLVRVNRGALPLYGADAERIDPLRWCRGLRGHRATECAAYAVQRVKGHRNRHLSGRLIGWRLPEPEANEARERARREHGSQVTEEQLESAEYVVLFTTAPKTRLTAARCLQAYRLRWQVELQFKRWKSLCHFDRLPNYRDDTIVSWLTAKVLLGLVLDRIGSTALAPFAPGTSSPVARQPWKVTGILWPLIIAAVMPLHLADAAERLSDIADLLDEMDVDPGSRQIPDFRNRLDCAPTLSTCCEVPLTQNC